MGQNSNGAVGGESQVMEGITSKSLKNVLTKVVHRNKGEDEFLNALNEVAMSLQPVFEKRPELLPVFEQLCEPERQVIFRVAWLNDQNEMEVNRGFRVQYSSVIGPYKGGLRFHPTVDLSIIKMLGFEQIFKNALTSLPLGGAKGGSDFNPKGRSDGEIQRFCQSFMTELVRHIAQDVDVPAGDIGVGPREIGYLYGQYRRISGRFDAALTGKGVNFGGSLCRPEATGYGVVFITEEMLRECDQKLEGARCAVSGAGNVALNCAAKLVESGAVVVSLSDSQGTLVASDGFKKEQIDEIKRLKANHKGKLSEYGHNDDSLQFIADERPWKLDAVGNVDFAFPCATQGELDKDDAEALATKGCRAVIEGANMPVTAAGACVLHSRDIKFLSGKMANAGGVAVSGLEMVQNRAMVAWEGDEVYEKLKGIMHDIYRTAKQNAEEYEVDIGAGATIAAFLKVGEALLAQGAV